MSFGSPAAYDAMLGLPPSIASLLQTVPIRHEDGTVTMEPTMRLEDAERMFGYLYSQSPIKSKLGNVRALAKQLTQLTSDKMEASMISESEAMYMVTEDQRQSQCFASDMESLRDVIKTQVYLHDRMLCVTSQLRGSKPKAVVYEGTRFESIHAAFSNALTTALSMTATPTEDEARMQEIALLVSTAKAKSLLFTQIVERNTAQVRRLKLDERRIMCDIQARFAKVELNTRKAAQLLDALVTRRTAKLSSSSGSSSNHSINSSNSLCNESTTQQQQQQQQLPSELLCAKTKRKKKVKTRRSQCDAVLFTGALPHMGAYTAGSDEAEDVVSDTRNAEVVRDSSTGDGEASLRAELGSLCTDLTKSQIRAKAHNVTIARAKKSDVQRQAIVTTRERVSAVQQLSDLPDVKAASFVTGDNVEAISGGTCDKKLKQKLKQKKKQESKAARPAAIHLDQFLTQ